MVTTIVVLMLAILFVIWIYALLLSGQDCDGMGCDYCPYRDQCTKPIQTMLRGKKK